MVQINLSIEMDSCTTVTICTLSRMARPYFTQGHYYLWYHHLWSYIHTVTINKQQCNVVLFTFLIVSMRLTWLIGSLFFSRTTLKWLTFQYKHKNAYHTHTYITHTYESHTYVYTHKHTHTHVQGLNQWHLETFQLDTYLVLGDKNVINIYSIALIYQTKWRYGKISYTHLHGHILYKYDLSTSQFWSIMMPSSWHSCQWLEMETSPVLASL